MKRFVHELRYSRKITHRNVIRIYDFLYIQGNYAISMEYFPSHTLGAEIVNEKPLALKRALQFGIDIATGMAVAHQVGIVHRDLKPANVLINDEATAQDRRFRRRRRAARGRHPADEDRLCHRLAQVHGARADPRPQGR